MAAPVSIARGELAGRGGGVDVQAEGADAGPNGGAAVAAGVVPKSAGLGFTFKRDSRTGNWQVFQ